MKMFYNGTPVESMKIKHYEMNTNDATLKASDMQSGVTAYARGQKVIGTGKCFSFASYGNLRTNESDIVPSIINVIHIGCVDYPIKMAIPTSSMIHCDFSVVQKVAEVTIEDIAYPIFASVQDNEFLITCEKNINLELFIGKDEYV